MLSTLLCQTTPPLAVPAFSLVLLLADSCGRGVAPCPFS